MRGVMGVIQSSQKAIKWFLLAAQKGDVTGQYNLGRSYSDGQGVPKDYKEAMKWYRMAAEQGMPQAQYQLARMYGNGDGVRPDLETAYMWAYIASNRDGEAFAPAAEVLTLLDKEMTNAEIAQGTLWARECMSSNYKNCGY